MKKQVLLFVCMVLAGSYLLLSQPGIQKGPVSAGKTLYYETPDPRGGDESHPAISWNSENQLPVQNSVAGVKEILVPNENLDNQEVFSVTFNVDMTDAYAEGGTIFNPVFHSVYISGTFADWAQPGSNPDFKLSPVSKSTSIEKSDHQWSEADNIYTITLDVEYGDHFYKFFMVESTPTWDMGEWPGDPNRSVFIEGPVLVEHVWGSITNLFAGGLGVEWDPFLVANAQHLDNIRHYPSSSFLQIADIDLGEAPWNEGEGWLPIGNNLSSFSGSYDGGGYTIQNLTINRPEEGYIGLFGRINYATLVNIRLENVNITASNRVGALCGLAYYSTISRCSAEGTVNALGNWAGGLVGVNFSYSEISTSYAAVHVEATGYSAGGLTGTNENESYVFNSYATGNVSGLRNVGGLVGFMSGYCFVEFCYSTGFVSADLYTGGLIGRQDGYNSVYYSYWNVETSGQNTSAGGTPLTTAQMLQNINFEEWDYVYIWNIIAGSTYPFLWFQTVPGDFNYPNTFLAPSEIKAIGNDRKISISWEAPSLGSPTGYKLFRDGEIIATPGSAATSYDDTDVENYEMHIYHLVAVYNEQESRPSPKVIAFAHTGFAGGMGTEENPYLVSTPGELFTVRLFPESFFLQTSDIELRGSTLNQEEGWLPIGSRSEAFLGQYDGNNHTVSNLFINRDINMYQGLFSVNQGTIMNLGVIEAQINAPMGMAGILAGTNYGLIVNCYSSGQITSTGSFGRIGGLTGWNSGTILDSRSTAVVNSLGLIVGGLTGANSNGMIVQSYSDGIVYGNSSTGGLTGINQSGSMIVSSFSNSNVLATGNNSAGISGVNSNYSSIIDCYSTGNISGNMSAGGVVGLLTENSYIYNCYSSGEISGNESLGGLVAINEGTENVTASYWDTNTSGQNTSAGGIPKNTREMVTQQTFVDWDFEETWGIHDGLSYPYFLWQGEPGPHNFPDEIPEFYYLTLVANPPVGGIVYGSGSFLLGQVISIYATANAGYRFANWTGHTSYADHPDHETCNVTMPAENIVLTANFELTTGISELSQSGLHIYPNPASDRLWVDFEHNGGNNFSIQLINAQGQLVDNIVSGQQGDGRICLDVSGLPGGMYILAIRGEQVVTTRKILIRP
jgi:hypothetical protein